MVVLRGGDDSQGKRRADDTRSRWAQLGAVLIVGICLGLLVSEKLYVASREAARAEAASAAGAAGGGAGGRALAAGATQGGALRLGGVRRSGAAAVGRGKAGPGKSRAPSPLLLEPDAIPRSTSGRPRNALETVLRKVAPDGEVLIAISNFHLVGDGALPMWIDSVRRAKVANWLVVAIDAELAAYCAERGVPHYFRPTKVAASQADGGSNHAISATKYEIVSEFVSLGWSTLLSDVDIVTLSDPFDALHRDADVEAMSDGWDAPTAYGESIGLEDPSMGWSRWSGAIRRSVCNSGLFYVRANRRVLDALTRIAGRLSKESTWDQTVFNEVVQTPSHGDYTSPRLVLRIMDIEVFTNSKVLFKTIRHLPKDKQPVPVMLHMNYHPDKSARMRAAIRHYVDGDETALDAFPGGSEPGT